MELGNRNGEVSVGRFARETTYVVEWFADQAHFASREQLCGGKMHFHLST
jgi:hypothetical protein